MLEKKNSAGITLIECVIAMALSFLVLSSILEMYLIAENNRHLQTSVMTMQENAEIVSQVLKHRIQKSSWFGCAKLTDDFPFKNRLPFLLNEKNKITTYQNVDIKEGTDAIRIWHTSSHGAILTKKMRGYSVLYISSNLSLKINDDLIISDCKTAETVRVKQVISMGQGVQKIVSEEPLEKLYDEHSEVSKLEMEAFFVGATSRRDEQNHPVYALFSKNIKGEKTEWIEGVSQMKIFFSTITDNTLVEYPIHDLKNSDEIKGISFLFDLIAPLDSSLHKKWNVYVAVL